MRKNFKIIFFIVSIFFIIFIFFKITGFQATEMDALINYKYDISTSKVYVIIPSKNIFKKVEITPYEISPNNEVTIEVIEGEKFTLSLLSNDVNKGGSTFTWEIKNNDLGKESIIKLDNSYIINPKRKSTWGFILKPKLVTITRENFSFTAIKNSSTSILMKNWKDGVNSKEFDHNLKININVVSFK